MAEELSFRWEACAGGARLLRVYGDTPCPAIPPRIEGRPVTELGPYCFAAKELPGGRLTGPATHPITGSFVTAVRLPAPLRVLNSAAFYDCRKLTHLTVGPAAESLGSDLFTNCAALADLELDAAPAAPTGLKKLLGALSGDITVHFMPGGAEVLRLFYPEYFEYLDENTPAHIFNHSIEGIGYRYRQCFDGGVLRLAEYDTAFAQATVNEPPAKLCRLALGRLLCPFGLSGEGAAAYRAYLAAHGVEAARFATAQRDDAALRCLCGGILSESDRRAAAEACARAGWSAGAALLLAAGAKKPRKTYSFDDF